MERKIEKFRSIIVEKFGFPHQIEPLSIEPLSNGKKYIWVSPNVELIVYDWNDLYNEDDDVNIDDPFYIPTPALIINFQKNGMDIWEYYTVILKDTIENIYPERSTKSTDDEFRLHLDFIKRNVYEQSSSPSLQEL